MTTTSTLTGNNASVINSINNSKTTSTASGTTSQSATAKSSLGTNFNTFLNMLTVQLKHQDPMSPMDSTQFTNQLVQFSAVEQEINTNSNLETLISLQQTSQMASAISYVGQTVEVAGSTLPLQNGKASFSYTMPSDAQNITVSIRDSSGKFVTNMKTVDGTTGRHEMSWDGTDTNGSKMPDGKYTIQITANDAQGNAITPTTTVYGKVTDVSSAPSSTDSTSTSTTNTTMLGMSGVVTTLDKILTIRDTASLASSQISN